MHESVAGGVESGCAALRRLGRTQTAAAGSTVGGRKACTAALRQKLDTAARGPRSALEQDLGRDFGCAAAAADELDRLVEVGLAVRDALRERERVARLHEDMEPPAFDLAALVLFSLEDRQVVHLA
jgi:hypothetical protein